MKTLTKRTSATVAAAAILAPLSALSFASIASADGGLGPGYSGKYVYKNADVTLPSAANPYAQFKSTGVVSKTSTGDYKAGGQLVIKYSNGDVQTISSIDNGTGTKAKPSYSVENDVTTPNNGHYTGYTLADGDFHQAITYKATTTAAANVRTGPSTNSKIMTTLPQGATVEVTYDEYSTPTGGWWSAHNAQIDAANAKSFGGDASPEMSKSTFTLRPLA